MKCSIDIRLDSLQGRVFKFLGKKGKADAAKVFGEGSVTMSNTAKFKNSAKLFDALKTVKDRFQKHGLFIHKEDSVIQSINARLFSNLLDPKRLITRINDVAGFGVISTKKFNGDYWLRVSDDTYAKDNTAAENKARRERIVKYNLRKIDDANAHFVKIVGRPGIGVTKIGEGYKLTFDQDVMDEFNGESYANYVKNMTRYLTKDEDTINDSFEQSPIEIKLKDELRFLRGEKKKLVSAGGSITAINDLDNKIRVTNDRLLGIQEDQQISDIYTEAELDLKEVTELLQKKEISTSEANDALKKLELWIKAGDFSDRGKHIFLDEDLEQNTEIRAEFLELAKRATELIVDLKEIGEGILSNNVNKKLGTDITFKEITTLSHALSWVGSKVLSLNRVGNALAQYIQKIVNEAKNSAFIEAKQKSRDLADLYKTLKDKGIKDIIFMQLDDSDTPTGRLIGKFSDRFFKNRRRLKGNKYDRKKFLIDINPLKVSSKTDPKVKEEYRNMLVEHLGEKEADKYIKEAQQKYAEYVEIRNAFIENQFGIKALNEDGTIDTTELDEGEKEELKEWQEINSPVSRLKALQSSKETYTNKIKGKDTFLVTIPKRILDNEDATGLYDERFDTIERDDDAYKFYQEAEKITKHANIVYGSNSFSSHSLAFIQRSLISKFNENKVGDFLSKEVYNAIVKEMSATDTEGTEINPITGKPDYQVRKGTIAIDTLIKNKSLEKVEKLEKEKGVPLTEAEFNEVVDKTSREVFADIGEVNLFQSLNIMNLAAIGFKHKMAIEDQVNMAMTYLPKSHATVGDDIVDINNNPVAKVYIDRMVEMAENFLRVAYYDRGIADTSFVVSKVYNTEEKARKKVIEKELQNEKLSETEKFKLTEELSELGGKLTTNTLFRKVLDWFRLKGIGWNIPAAGANLIYGKITNFYAAFDKRLFTLSELGSAEKLLLTENGKFNKVIENYNILGDILFEFKETAKFEEKQNWWGKAIKAVKPYMLQTEAEKQNQGSIMIAMLLHNKVTDTKTGETKSFWEAIGDNGRLNDSWVFEGKSGEKAVVDMVSRIKSQVEEIHGDYSNPLLVKKSVGGQALSMFKLWFFEAVHNRIGSERTDYIRKITVKGRYRTVYDLIAKNKLNFAEMYRKYKNNELSEVDAANMRKNFAELIVIVLGLALQAGLKAAICGEDKKCKDANIFQLTLLNLTKRVTSEITFYLNFKEWNSFLKNPAAITGVLGDVGKLADLSYRTLFGEEDSLIIQSGYNKDRNRWTIWGEKQIPLVTQLRRLHRYGNEYMNFN